MIIEKQFGCIHSKNDIKYVIRIYKFIPQNIENLFHFIAVVIIFEIQQIIKKSVLNKLHCRMNHFSHHKDFF